jgi:predicted ATPase
MRLTKLSVKNFSVFKDVEFDFSSPLTVLIGENGSGKSTFFQVLKFLKLAQEFDIEKVCNEFGGFDQIRTKDTHEGIEITLTAVGIIKRGLIDGTSDIRQHEHVYKLILNKTSEGVLEKHEEYMENGERVNFKIEPGVMLPFSLSCLFSMIFFDFDVSKFRGLKKQVDIKNQRVFNEESLASFLYEYKEKNPETFKKIISNLISYIPSIEDITVQLIKNVIFIEFKNKGVTSPISYDRMSDGTLKLLMYLTLIYMPMGYGYSFLCIEEPEKDFYPELLNSIMALFRSYAFQNQVILSTHFPTFINELEPEEVLILKKQENGFSQVFSPASDEVVKNLLNEGQSLGSLWGSSLLTRDRK